MRKTLLLLLILLFNVVSANSLMASNEPIGAIIAHHGKLTRTYVNGEKNTGQDVLVYTTKVSENVYHFYLSPFKAGRMPGTISLEAKDIKVNNDGTFQSELLTNAILMQIGRYIKLPFNGKISGRLTKEGKLTLRIESKNASFMGRTINVNITFEEN